LLDAIDLSKRYGSVPALDGFNLHVDAGEIVGLVGHNGAGKSTFIEITSNLIRADGGTVLINGRPPAKAKGTVGTAPQSIALYRVVTVREHLRLFGSIAGLRRAALDNAVDEVVAALRLGDFLDRRAGVLSGGQQRRTQAAIALIHRPGLLLLDEPTAGADPETRQALLDVVKQRAGEGAAVVYITHYLPELADLRATIAVARAGQVIARGTAEQLLDGLPGEVRLGVRDQEITETTTDPTATLMELLSRADGPITSIELRKPSLDDLYRSLAVSDVH